MDKVYNETAYIISITVEQKQYLIPRAYSEDEIYTLLGQLDEPIPKGIHIDEFFCGDSPADGLEDVILEQVQQADPDNLILPVMLEDILDAPAPYGLKIKHKEQGTFSVLHKLKDLAIIRTPGGTALVFIDGQYKLLVETELVPLSFREAKQFVTEHHRHNAAPPGHKFSIGLKEAGSGKLIGVAIASRPKARHQDDGFTLEANRVCTDERYADACSKLYAAVIRAGKAMGYKRIITYTRPTESGGSMRAVGFVCDGLTSATDCWDTPSRPRDKKRTRREVNSGGFCL